MRTILTFAAVAITLGLTNQANASSVSGYISKTAYTGSRVFVWVNGNRDGASCNTPGAGQRYELDGSNPVGQTQISMILTAKASHQAIYISGTNGCPTDTELIGYLETLP